MKKCMVKIDDLVKILSVRGASILALDGIRPMEMQAIASSAEVLGEGEEPVSSLPHTGCLDIRGQELIPGTYMIVDMKIAIPAGK